MGVLATPGLDYMPRNALRTAKNRALLEERIGAVPARIGFGLVTFNRKLRLPLVELLGPLQKPFRIAQSWNLYRDGPKRMRKMEIQIDDQAVFRLGDPELDWLRGPLSNRKMRPVMESTARSTESRNWRGFARFVIDRAREDYPQAQSVALIFKVGDFPGEQLEETHRVVATAPGWEAHQQ